ncbi:hypothetical protein [Haliscomenobacter hydrossis]|uniref:Uncharacterized protein n=1 Tax=Haliscomenobacter hydrossis (strain ATCC 27775 / DSM 1100 / LMG 10767 / O) TaxID=760192 RepID=F4L851_HALH1|nr:hypothetical protein [Haliscomenobacter hydrossis]AEE54559.1 hypothetical protein Halhy_6745 [Haliscomenobacter hydrossis DSM 1100]
MSTKPTLLPPQTGFLLVEIVYGLVSRDCRGMGICKLRPVSPTLALSSTSPCGSSIAWAGMGKQGSFELLVLRNTVSEEQWERRFTGGRFVMEEAFGLPEELLGQSREIQAGSYPVEVKENYLRILF